MTKTNWIWMREKAMSRKKRLSGEKKEVEFVFTHPLNVWLNKQPEPWSGSLVFRYWAATRSFLFSPLWRIFLCPRVLVVVSLYHRVHTTKYFSFFQPFYQNCVTVCRGWPSSIPFLFISPFDFFQLSLSFWLPFIPRFLCSSVRHVWISCQSRKKKTSSGTNYFYFSLKFNQSDKQSTFIDLR